MATPSLWACGKANRVEHALSCCKGGHVIRRHNEIRDVTVSLLGEVTQNVEITTTTQEYKHGRCSQSGCKVH